MEKRFFFAKNPAQDIVAIDSIIAAWKNDEEPQITLWLHDCENEFYFYYESDHARDMDLARLKSELKPNLS